MTAIFLFLIFPTFPLPLTILFLTFLPLLLFFPLLFPVPSPSPSSPSSVCSSPSSSSSLLSLLPLLLPSSPSPSPSSSSLAGYHSARMFRTLKGSDWKKAAALTAMLYPSILFGTGFFLNFFIWGEHSSGAVSSMSR